MYTITLLYATTFPSWALAIIIILGLFGLFLACWGLFSAIKFSAKNKVELLSISKYFKGKAVFNSHTLASAPSGTYALVFLQDHIDQYFKPIYVFGTDNLLNDADHIWNLQQSNPKHPITQYIILTNSNFENTVFVLIEQQNSVENIQKWIELLETDKRGLNS